MSPFVRSVESKVRSQPRMTLSRARVGGVLLCALGDDIAAALGHALTMEGQEVRVTRDASSALRAMQAEAPSIVIVGGTSRRAVAESCRRLRAAGPCRNAVILAVASERLEDVRTLLEAGADDFLLAYADDDLLRSRFLVAQRAAERTQALIVTATAAKRDLRVLSESLATTLDSIGDGVIATNVAGVITRMNPAAERLTGWTRAEATGRLLAEVLQVVSGDTRARVENPPDRALREGASVSLPDRTVLVRRDGTESPISDSCSPIRAADGTVEGAVLVFHDCGAPT